MAREMELDDFLADRGSRSAGGGGSYLWDWKKDGKLDVWLHPAGKPVKIYMHRWYTVGKDRETNQPKLRPMRFNTLEDDTVIEKRFFRDRDTGDLEYPPEICPFAKLLEWVHQACKSGVINWLDHIFRFEVGDRTIRMRAGGFTGAFTSRKLTEKQRKELRDGGVVLTEAWKESCQPRAQYVFRVVKNAEPEKGCLIAMEAEALGLAVQKVIRDRIEDLAQKHGEADAKRLGSPWTNPYCIRWKYDETKDFSDRYDAKAMFSIDMSDEVKAALKADAPSVGEDTGPGNIAMLRASFESHWCHQVRPPWDELFAVAEEKLAGTPAAASPDSFDYGANAKDEEPAETFVCDECGGTMQADEFVCPKCGAEYNEEGVLIKKPEPPKRTRSQAKAAKEEAKPLRPGKIAEGSDDLPWGR